MRNEKAGSGESVSRRAPSVVSEATTTSYQGFYAIFSIQFDLIETIFNHFDNANH